MLISIAEVGLNSQNLAVKTFRGMGFTLFDANADFQLHLETQCHSKEQEKSYS